MSTKPVFHNLWPTTIMSVNLPGAEMANATLIDFINELDDERSQLTTKYLDQAFMEIDHPVIKWLNDCFTHAALDYAKNCGINYDLEFSVQGWPNINQFGDYHNLHNHPHSWLSGTYYVCVPSDAASIGSRSDLNPNEISFFEEDSTLICESGFNFDKEKKFQEVSFQAKKSKNKGFFEKFFNFFN